MRIEVTRRRRRRGGRAAGRAGRGAAGTSRSPAGRRRGVAYERAAALGADWSRSVLWFGDDRCVPPDDERSNYRLAKETLLDRIPPELAPRVERIEGELGPDEARRRYEQQLRRELGGDDPARST